MKIIIGKSVCHYLCVSVNTGSNLTLGEGRVGHALSHCVVVKRGSLSNRCRATNMFFCLRALLCTMVIQLVSPDLVD